MVIVATHSAGEAWNTRGSQCALSYLAQMPQQPALSEPVDLSMRPTHELFWPRSFLTKSTQQTTIPLLNVTSARALQNTSMSFSSPQSLCFIACLLMSLMERILENCSALGHEAAL